MYKTSGVFNFNEGIALYATHIILLVKHMFKLIDHLSYIDTHPCECRKCYLV